MSVRLTIVALACFMSASALARADDAKHVNVPAGSLIEALESLAKQCGVDVIYPSNELKGLKTHGVSGTLEPEVAFRKLIEGTPLLLKKEGSALLIMLPSASPRATSRDATEASPPEPGQEGKRSSSDGFRVAQADQGQTAGSGPLERKAQRVGPSKPELLEEVIVTAQKREERLIDVPISMVTLSADELQKREIISIDDLSMAVPGLSIQSTGSGARRIMLRGISNGIGNSSLIGLYLDEASVTSNLTQQLDLRTYDLERVEVLRGPQGTLYGEGSMGGTIRFITRDPVLNQFAMNADVAAIFTQDGAPGQRIESMVNIPLVASQLGLRLVTTFDHEGGWIDQPAADVKNFNNQNLTDVRLKGLWQPSSAFTVNAMTVIHRNTAPQNVGEDVNGNFTQKLGFTTTPSNTDDYNIYNVTLAYDFPLARLLSTTSYISQSQKSKDSGIFFPFIQPPPLFEAYEPLQQSSNENFNDELRLTSIGSTAWQWTLGAFYRHVISDLFIPPFYFGTAGTPPGPPLPSTLQDSASKSSAVFADTSYKFLDRLTIGAGVRYFHDDQESTTATGGVPAEAQATFHALTPRFYADYKFADQFNGYASASKGFRSGGINGLGQPNYDPESVWTYELGIKSSLAGGGVSADIDVFYSDYTNYQITGILPPPAPPFSVISNAGSARIKGAEWSFAWRPNDQWTLGVNGDYIESHFYVINATSSSYNVGDPLDFFPKYGYTLSAQRDANLGGKHAFLRLDYNKLGRSTYRNRSYGPWYFSESDVIDMLNFNAGLHWSEALSFSLFAQNLLNDRGLITPTSIEDTASRSRPRNFGVGFSLRL